MLICFQSIFNIAAFCERWSVKLSYTDWRKAKRKKKDISSLFAANEAP